MRSSNPVSICKVLAFVLLFCAFCQSSANAQSSGSNTAAQPQQRQTVLYPDSRPAAAVAHRNEVVCGGFIEQNPTAAQGQIVGAEQERERHAFVQGDLVFIDAGAQAGVKAGQEFSVVRPRGQVSSKFSHKSGSLGVYTQEVGTLRVVRVRERVSVAEVTLSCGELLLGDLLRPAQTRDVPAGRSQGTLDHFADPTGKRTGSIVFARDGRETVSRDQVVFIDLGAEDEIKVGDYLTVFRPEGHARIVENSDEIVANARDGYESDELRGGGFSNQAQRVKNVSGSKRGITVKSPSIKRQRPPVPRLVVGEIVVLRVEGRTATAVITRATREVHTGDAVELQ